MMHQECATLGLPWPTLGSLSELERSCFVAKGILELGGNIVDEGEIIGI